MRICKEIVAMGQWFSGQNQNVEQVERGANSYRYPPLTGTYFASRFQMGGEWFDTTQPESYLFGDNHDINFLGRRPCQFPYPVPQVGEPTRTVQSLINIRKDSLKLVRTTVNSHTYNVEFIFDSEVKCVISLYYMATEDLTTDGRLIYIPKSPDLKSKSYVYKRGSDQTFKEPTCLITPKTFPENELSFNRDKPEMYPLVIHIEADDAELSVDNQGHSHVLIGSFEKLSDGSYVVKSVKQKQMIDGCVYVLQEIYGLENKGQKAAKPIDQDDGYEEDEDDDDDDGGSQSGAECLICMEEPKDTFFLPCRHLCVCHECAESLRYRASNCPICRQPFKALLQLKALQRARATLAEETDNAGARSKAKYTVVPLLEALNNCSGRGTMAYSHQDADVSLFDVGAGNEDLTTIDSSSCTTAVDWTPPSSMHPLLEVSLPGTPLHSDGRSSSASVTSTTKVEVDDELPSVEEVDETSMKV